MSEKIIAVQHRHDGSEDLVLEVGKGLPPHYQDGRRAGLTVNSIEGRDPVICTLSDGDRIYIGKGSVDAIVRDKPDA